MLNLAQICRKQAENIQIYIYSKNAPQYTHTHTAKLDKEEDIFFKKYDKKFFDEEMTRIFFHWKWNLMDFARTCCRVNADQSTGL